MSRTVGDLSLLWCFVDTQDKSTSPSKYLIGRVERYEVECE